MIISQCFVQYCYNVNYTSMSTSMSACMLSHSMLVGLCTRTDNPRFNQLQSIHNTVCCCTSWTLLTHCIINITVHLVYTGKYCLDFHFWTGSCHNNPTHFPSFYLQYVLKKVSFSTLLAHISKTKSAPINIASEKNYIKYSPKTCYYPCKKLIFF